MTEHLHQNQAAITGRMVLGLVAAGYLVISGMALNSQSCAHFGGRY